MVPVMAGRPECSPPDAQPGRRSTRELAREGKHRDHTHGRHVLGAVPPSGWTCAHPSGVHPPVAAAPTRPGWECLRVPILEGWPVVKRPMCGSRNALSKLQLITAQLIGWALQKWWG